MKFGRNQPRSQPIVRVARRESHSTQQPPITTPALAQLDGASEHQVRKGEDDNERDVSAQIPVEACEGGMREVLSSAIARSQPLRA